jgi:hypothetical protein
MSDDDISKRAIEIWDEYEETMKQLDALKRRQRELAHELLGLAKQREREREAA